MKTTSGFGMLKGAITFKDWQDHHEEAKREEKEKDEQDSKDAKRILAEISPENKKPIQRKNSRKKPA